MIELLPATLISTASAFPLNQNKININLTSFPSNFCYDNAGFGKRTKKNGATGEILLALCERNYNFCKVI